MKKIISVFLLVVMVASMMIAASAADTKVYKTYKEAKDGDLLWIVDFSSTGGAFKPVGDDNFNKVSDAIVSENGRAVTVKSKAGDYGNISANALEDKDGFMQVKLEYDAAAGEFRGYVFTKDNKWTMTPLTWKMSGLNDKDDCLGVVLYTYYNVCDATYKDVKIFRGINLTDAQLAAEAPKDPAETTAAVTQAQPTPSAPAAPTADVAVILSMVAAIAASGAVVLKKKH